MSYCVNCGVELAKSEKKCPLCGVEAVNPKEKGEPAGKPPYPKELKETPHVNSHSLAVLLTLVFLLPMALTLTSDVSSVSYTHLDVYKRQTMACHSARSGGGVLMPSFRHTTSSSPSFAMRRGTS